MAATLKGSGPENFAGLVVGDGFPHVIPAAHPVRALKRVGVLREGRPAPPCPRTCCKGFCSPYVKEGGALVQTELALNDCFPSPFLLSSPT